MISKNSRGARATSTGEQAPARAGVEVELRHLRKSFHEGRTERSVLRDVNASFRAGEFIVLLGRSGSGKSTLLNLIAGLEVPSAGSVRIEATDVSALSEHQRTLFRRHRIGFIFQSYNLIPTLTVEENLLLPLELDGSARTRDWRRATQLLERVGLADRGSSFPDVLSGGEQQRLAVARWWRATAASCPSTRAASPSTSSPTGRAPPPAPATPVAGASPSPSTTSSSASNPPRRTRSCCSPSATGKEPSACTAAQPVAPSQASAMLAGVGYAELTGYPGAEK